MTDTALTPAKPASLKRFDDMAERIKAEYKALLDAGVSFVQRAIKFGETLNAERERFGTNGKWLDWVRDNCGIHPRTAQRYMEFAEPQNKAKIQAALAKLEPKEAASLSFNKAYALLKGPTDSSDTTSTRTSDSYDAREEKLIEKLEKLGPDEADAAAKRTMEKMKEIVKIKKGGLQK